MTNLFLNSFIFPKPIQLLYQINIQVVLIIILILMDSFPIDEQQKYQINRQVYFTELKICLDQNQSRSFNKSLYNWIKSNPPKGQIKTIGEQIRQILIYNSQNFAFKSIVDELIVIIKLIQIMSASPQMNQKDEEMFNKKVNLIFGKLRKQKLTTWMNNIQNNVKLNQLKIVNLTLLLKQREQQYKLVMEKISMFNNISEKLEKMKEKYHFQGQNELQKLKGLQFLIEKLQSKIKGKQVILEEQKQNKTIIKPTLNTLIKQDLLQKRQEILENKINQIPTKKSISSSSMNWKNNELTNKLQLNSEIIKIDSDVFNYLKSSLNEVVNVKATKFEQLFSSKYSQCKNFHTAFDGKPNILLIVKLINGRIIGAFSKEQFKPNCSGENGFLINFSKKQVYKRLQKSTISYEEFHIIFGNSQLSIKSGDQSVFSNFAVPNRNFDSNGRSIDHFLGEDRRREVKLQLYEIYQVHSS